VIRIRRLAVSVILIGILSLLPRVPLPAEASQPVPRPPDQVLHVAPLPSPSGPLTAAAEIPSGTVSKLRGQLVPDEVSYEAAKQRAFAAEQTQEAADGKVEKSSIATPSPFAVVGSGGVQRGISATDTCSICVVPDTTGSINSSFYVEIVNERLAIYNRSLASVEPSVDLGAFGFSGSVPPGQLTTDPQMQWDQAAGRWLYALISTNSAMTTSYILWGTKSLEAPTSSSPSQRTMSLRQQWS